MRIGLRLLCVVALCGVAASRVRAQDYPAPIGYVNDFAQLLSVAERDKLNSELAAFDASMLCQIVAVTVPSLEGKIIDAYTLGLARHWGVGSRRNNCGIVVLMSPKTREIRVEVAKGLTNTLTTQRVAKLISVVFVPRFRNQQWYLGFYEGIDALKFLVAQDRELR
ncbi:MAG: TPM domain-containing protein [Candidatus Pacebacteria bacterium]|nr:TPM domain-containing protein [Candidatus Paceibacterota bacterium]